MKKMYRYIAIIFLFLAIVGVVVFVTVSCNTPSNEGYACAPYLNGGIGKLPTNNCTYYPDQPLRNDNGKYVYFCTGSQWLAPQNTSPCELTNTDMLTIATKGCTDSSVQNDWEYTPQQIAEACLQKTRYERLAHYRPDARGPYRKIDLNAYPCDASNCPFPYWCVGGNCLLMDESIQNMVAEHVSDLNAM